MYRYRGFGLIELMIAITLGLILSTAIIQVFLASRTTYQVQESLSMIQENARFGMHFMGKEIRMSGYMGCNSLGNVNVNVIAKPASAVAFVPLLGENNVGNSNDFNALPGSDTLEIKRGSDEMITLTGNLALGNDQLRIEDNTHNFVKGDYLLASDCSSADIFRITNAPKKAGEGTTTLIHDTSANSSSNLSKVYGADTDIYGFETTRFFVRDTGRTNASGQAIYSLFSQQRAIGSGGTMGAAVELIEGVENLQLEYGIDANEDRAIDRYVDASLVSDWNTVVSVKVELTLVGNDPGVVGQTGQTDAQSVYDSAGQLLKNADGRMRQVVSSVFAVRNRLQ